VSKLSASKLKKSYKSKDIVNEVSLDLNRGEIVGLLGPNGAGKTTCFYMIIGLVPCDSGKITLNGEDLTSLPMDVRARKGIGYLPQEPSVFRKLSVQENILAVLETLSITREQREEKCEKLLQEFNISHIRHSQGISLSGGERRRVEIARSLASEPSFILLDEPFAGIDPISVLDIQTLITHLKKRKIGILITDHNVRETLGICDRAYILGDSGIITQGSPEDILKNKQVKDVYLGEDFRL